MEEESLIERVFSNRKLKILTLLIVDFLLILVAYFLAFIFRLYLDNNSLNEIIIYFKEHIFKVIFFISLPLLIVTFTLEPLSTDSLALGL